MAETDPTISRRTALTAVGAAGMVATVAACGSVTTRQRPSATTQEPRASAGHTLAKLDAIPVGQAVSAELGSAPVVVARPSETTAACFSAICTHMGCTVSPVGKQLHCPCHGSVYNATTGKVISGPAPRPLPRIPVQIEHGEVVTA
jgi:cytochrome b6-f complex iron-sulfur subunit